MTMRCDWLRGLMCVALITGCSGMASAVDVSAPAMLQIFEAKWDTIQDRMVDIFDIGYGRLWVPPPSRADSGNQSVGYDVFDRFDLGRPRNETLYGTEVGLKTMIQQAHRSGVLVNTDYIANHNGFSNLGTVDNNGTPANLLDDVTFAQSGGYPGFAVTLPGDVDGDFHGAFESSEETFRLSGLIDIAQEKNHQFIRHPVAAGNPQNIPAGTLGIFGRPPANVPTASNARFYPDQGLGGTTVFDPAVGSNVTLYDFNTADPLAGDAYAENATGLLIRNIRWMIQEVGVDGFRFDAGRHFPRWVLNYLDQGAFLAKEETLLDGSPQHPFSFTETGYDSASFHQGFIRKDINNANLGQVGGNRDVLDFNLFGALKANLTENGGVNNWHGIRHASIDYNLDATHDGDQGVAFAQSHDELGPALQNVAYAYILMRPGNALVYTNAKEFGTGRDFPRGGKVDALGGFYGDAITTLVDIRNTHGRGNFHERWIDNAFNPNGFSNIYIYERSNSAIVGLNSRNDNVVETRSGVQTNFAPNTILVELTGNAADPLVDTGNVIPETVKVNGTGQISISIPANGGVGGHGRGYVIYGLATPQGTLSLTNVADTLDGAIPTAANNGTARLADIDVIYANSFQVQLNTTPVSLLDPTTSLMVRDYDADGDTAVVRVDGGMNLNNVAGIDDVAPGSVAYGFENFTDTRVPGYISSSGMNIGTGSGTYAQSIDTTQLSEGRHYVTVRAFRHRDSSTGGDGGPAVFTDFKRAIYVDRLAPESAVVSFDPYASSPNTLQNRDLIVKSTDGTADNMHLFLDLPAGLTNAQVLQMALNGQNDAGSYDVDSFVYGFNNVVTGNHVATVVTFEPTFDGVHGFNVQRFPGMFTATGVGLGFGDLNSNGVFQTTDISGLGNGSFETVLYSQNAQFKATADLDGNGRVDNLDLFSLGPSLVTSGASAAVLTAYDGVLQRRGDFNSDSVTNPLDMTELYSGFGIPGTNPDFWLLDLNVDGAVDIDDVATLIEEIVQTVPGDFDLDGDVDGRDFLTLQRNASLVVGARYDQGDADLSGVIDGADLAVWRAAYGTSGLVASAVDSASATLAVPEPSGLAGLCWGMGCIFLRKYRTTKE